MRMIMMMGMKRPPRLLTQCRPRLWWSWQREARMWWRTWSCLTMIEDQTGEKKCCSTAQSHYGLNPPSYNCKKYWTFFCFLCFLNVIFSDMYSADVSTIKVYFKKRRDEVSMLLFWVLFFSYDPKIGSFPLPIFESVSELKKKSIFFVYFCSLHCSERMCWTLYIWKLALGAVTKGWSTFPR